MKNNFYNVNLTYIAENADTLSLTGKQLIALVIMLRGITFEDKRNSFGGNIVRFDKKGDDTKEIVKAVTKTDSNYFNKTISKLIKVNILTRVKKNVYKVNNEVIRKGYLAWDNVKFMKVDSEATFYKMSKVDDMTAQEVKMLFFLLNTVNNDTNTLSFDKADRENMMSKFGCSKHTLQNFVNKVKEYGIIKKLNNKECKVNNTYITFRKTEEAGSRIEVVDNKLVLSKTGLVIEDRNQDIVGTDNVKELQLSTVISLIKYKNNKADRELLAVADARINAYDSSIDELFEVEDACLML